MRNLEETAELVATLKPMLKPEPLSSTGTVLLMKYDAGIGR